MTTYDCGHVSNEGGARTPDGRHICRACAEQEEYRAFVADTRELQQAKGAFFCYLSTSGDELTTWTGYKLARVTALWSQAVGFGWRTQRWYFRAVDEEGREWYGTSPGRGMYARARLAKG